MSKGFIIFEDGKCVIDVKKYVKKVSSFVDELCSDQDYMSYMKSQRRADPDKVRQNIMDSKLPECAVNEYLIGLGFPDIPSNPDFKVYKRNEKSWAPDLIYNLEKPWMELSGSKDINIAVKSCTVSTKERYGSSFIFNVGCDSQPNSLENAISGKKNRGLDELFISGTDKDIVAFVLFDQDLAKCEIRGFVNWSYLKNDYLNAFGNMRLPKYKNIKVAVYDSYLHKLLTGKSEVPEGHVETSVELPADVHADVCNHCCNRKITLSKYITDLIKKSLNYQ